MTSTKTMSRANSLASALLKIKQVFFFGKNPHVNHGMQTRSRAIPLKDHCTFSNKNHRDLQPVSSPLPVSYPFIPFQLTFLQLNMAMGNPSLIDDFPFQTSIYREFPAMFNYWILLEGILSFTILGQCHIWALLAHHPTCRSSVDPLLVLKTGKPLVGKG